MFDFYFVRFRSLGQLKIALRNRTTTKSNFNCSLSRYDLLVVRPILASQVCCVRAIGLSVRVLVQFICLFVFLSISGADSGVAVSRMYCMPISMICLLFANHQCKRMDEVNNKKKNHRRKEKNMKPYITGSALSLFNLAALVCASQV